MLLAVFWIGNSAWADNYDVICAGGSDPGTSATNNYTSIQQAVLAAAGAPTTSPHMISVSGNCTENVAIFGLQLSLDGLTIQGTPATPGTPDDSLTGDPSATAGGPPGVLFVSNSHLITINDMIINGTTSPRPQAVNFVDSHGFLARSVVQGAQQNGILVQNNSSLDITDTTVQNNGTNGVSVDRLSAVFIRNSILRNNAGNGLNVGNSSIANLPGDNFNTPSVVEKNEIANNGFNGIAVGGGSSMGGTGAHLIHHNGLRGVSITNSFGGLAGQSPTQPAEVYQNGSQGVFYVGATGGGLGNYVKVYQNNQNPPSPLPPGAPATLCGVCVNSGASVFLNETEISGEPGIGLYISRNSFANGRSLVITNNAGDGVRIEMAAGMEFLPPATTPMPGTPTNISQNGGESVNCADDLSWTAGDLTGIAKKVKCK
ncbi:MAG TPA: right-handed parallel beta-helix repeat-containing protein [Terriglobia bacterium]|nr:right-handed parallel beta-helix repeat-containing protein [Terriglobia bacterium]